jgi:hypothetical protein
MNSSTDSSAADSSGAASAPFASPGGASSSLQRLRTLLREEGGLMAGLVESTTDDREREGAGEVVENVARDSDGDTRSGRSMADRAIGSDGADGPAQLAAAGPRAARHPEDYELLVETIYEGYLLHYGAPRVALTADEDLALLAGDRLYALGLARLIGLGDITAVSELADTITLSALSQGAGQPELADAVWTAGARAIGWGSSDAHDRAKDLVLAGAPEAIEAMRTSAAGLAAPR